MRDKIARSADIVPPNASPSPQQFFRNFADIERWVSVRKTDGEATLRAAISDGEIDDGESLELAAEWLLVRERKRIETFANRSKKWTPLDALFALTVGAGGWLVVYLLLPTPERAHQQPDRQHAPAVAASAATEHEAESAP